MRAPAAEADTRSHQNSQLYACSRCASAPSRARKGKQIGGIVASDLIGPASRMRKGAAAVTMKFASAGSPTSNQGNASIMNVITALRIPAFYCPIQPPFHKRAGALNAPGPYLIHTVPSLPTPHPLG